MPSIADSLAAADVSALLADARRYIAGGVVSMNRKVSPEIVFICASGSRLTAADGREYIDYHAAFAPFLLGHNCEPVNEAVRAAMRAQWSLMGSGPTPWEVALAHDICAAVESVDNVQLTNTGSEATALAIRLSRAYTRREEIVLMLGGYNGWEDDVIRVVAPPLAVIGPRRSGQAYPFLPASAGIPRGNQERAHLVNFNDLESLEAVLKTRRIACVLMEPVLQNVGVLPPAAGYLAGVIALCERHGTLCVFDEVKTGFRSALGGYQSIAGVRPHLSVFGKAVANGYPMGVIGGRADIMALFGAENPSERVLIAGTYNAHPLNCAAALATLKVLRDPQTYLRLDSRCESLYAGLRAIFAERGMTATLVTNRSAYCVYFMDHVPVDWHDVLAHHDFALDARLRLALIERGIYHIPIACKQGSVSTAHTAADIERTLDMTRAAVGGL
jgi:glutamate-1-semialdehyde 2,1-aminomutase